MKRFTLIFTQSLLTFLVRYRRTALGPLWLLVAPALFIAVIGGLFSTIGNHKTEALVPSLASGLIFWNLISGFINSAPTLFIRNRAQLMQGSMMLDDIILADLVNTFISFAHQCIIIVAVMAIYHVDIGWSTALAILGLSFALANGYWVNTVFGILGARYRDLAEVFPAILRIAFLATPIIWIPEQGTRGGVMGAYLLLNPFYHFLEVFRAPLLGQSVAPISWAVTVTFTVCGFLMARFVRSRYTHLVPLWI